MIKNATVSARIDERVKTQAEDILRQLGIPVSVVINSLYHMIILKNGIPFTLEIPSHPKSLEEMSRTDFDAKLQHSYEQAIARQGKPMDEVFAAIKGKHAV